MMAQRVYSFMTPWEMILKDAGLCQVKVWCWPTEKGDEIRLIREAGSIVRDGNRQEQSKSWDLGTSAKAVCMSSVLNEVIEEVLLEVINNKELNIINPADSLLTWLMVTPWEGYQEGDNDSEMQVSHDAVFQDKRWWDPRVVEWVNIVWTIWVE